MYIIAKEASTGHRHTEVELVFVGAWMRRQLNGGKSPPRAPPHFRGGSKLGSTLTPAHFSQHHGPHREICKSQPVRYNLHS